MLDAGVERLRVPAALSVVGLSALCANHAVPAVASERSVSAEVALMVKFRTSASAILSWKLTAGSDPRETVTFEVPSGPKLPTSVRDWP